MRFTDGYAANPVCSPTRYSIMTGKYPSRIDATNFFSGRRSGSKCNTPVISTDFYPTILEVAGLKPRPGQHRDGVSLVPLLKGEDSLDRDALYWHYPHYSNQGGIPGGAIRMGRYKLIERFEDGSVNLYDLENDLGERKDLASEMPERVAQMRKKLHAWYKQVDAKFLQPQPDGPPPWRPAD